LIIALYNIILFDLSEFDWRRSLKLEKQLLVSSECSRPRSIETWALIGSLYFQLMVFWIVPIVILDIFGCTFVISYYMYIVDLIVYLIVNLIVYWLFGWHYLFTPITGRYCVSCILIIINYWRMNLWCSYILFPEISYGLICEKGMLLTCVVAHVDILLVSSQWPIIILWKRFFLIQVQSPRNLSETFLKFVVQILFNIIRKT